MGCGASKTSAQVVPVIQPLPPADHKKANVIEHSPSSTATPAPSQPNLPPLTVQHVPTPPVDAAKVTVSVSHDQNEKWPRSGEKRQEKKEANPVPLSRPVMPSIPSDNEELKKGHAGSLTKLNLKPVAFEIPLDEDLIARPVSRAGPINNGRDFSAGSNGSSSSQLTDGPGVLRAAGSGKLPKLGLTEQDLQAKLANTEARWKDLDHRKSSGRLRGTKPKLPSSTTTATSSATSAANPSADPKVLKQRLLTKEAKAQQRREREISKLQAKLAKQEDHARRVQERKRMLGKMSNEDLRLSWGGEKELPGIETIEIEREQMNGNNRNFDEDFPVGMTRPSTAVGGTNGVGFGFLNQYEGHKPFDADSGIAF